MKILFYSEKTKQEYVLIPVCTNYDLIKNGFISYYHIHPVYHLVYVVRGQGYLEHDDSRYLLKEKDIIVVNPNEKHIYTSNHETGMIHLTVNFFLLTVENFKTLENNGLFNNRTRIKANDVPAEVSKLDELFDFKADRIFVEFDMSKWDKLLALADAFTCMIEQIEKNPFFIISGNNRLNQVMLSDYYSRFIIDFLNCISGFDIKELNAFNKKDEILLNRITSYLNDTLNDKLSLHKLSKCLSYSPEYISSYFKKKTGMTITGYLNRLKIKKACEYLRSTDKTIVEIASDLSYSSSNHFSNNFKKEKNISPKDYRKHPELQ